MLMVHFTGHLVCNMGRAPPPTVYHGLFKIRYTTKFVGKILRTDSGRDRKMLGWHQYRHSKTHHDDPIRCYGTGQIKPQRVVSGAFQSSELGGYFRPSADIFQKNSLPEIFH